VTLTVLKAGSGTVTSNPSGIACGAACSIPLSRGSEITLIATPDGANGVFSGWTGGGCSGTQSTCAVRVDTDTTVNAAFGMTFAVTATVTGAPAGTSVTATSPTAGAACAGGSCTVPAGGAVTLTTPAVANYYFEGWSGGSGCTGTAATLSLSNVTGPIACVATYRATHLVTVNITGGPGTATITPTSTTPGATCTVGSCRIPTGGSLSATSPNLTNWFFNGWSGASNASTAAVTLSNVTNDATLTAGYINSRSVPCRDQPPANGMTTSTGNVTVTYTTAGGWTQPALCPFACQTDYCKVGGTSCQLEYVDQVSFQSGSASKWFGGDDRPNFSRSVGTGQGVTPTSTVTMNRFGFRVTSGFTFSTNNQFGTANNVVRLDRRDANGVIVATYSASLAPDFPGGWIYWNTPATTLPANQLQVFTAYLTNAFTQRVDTGSAGDAAAGYAGGGGYTGEVTSGDLNGWTSWGAHPWDFQFRVQSRNAQCQ